VNVVASGTHPRSDQQTFTIVVRKPPEKEQVAEKPIEQARPAEQNPFEVAGELKPANKIDELVFAKLKELKIPPANLCSDGVFPPPRLSRRHRHLADLAGGEGLPPGQEPQQTPCVDRASAWAARIRRLLGAEMERPVAGEGGVPDQPLAECGAGLSPLAADRDAGQHAVRPLRARAGHLQRQQFPHAASQLLPRVAEQAAAFGGAGGGTGVHGGAGGQMAEGATGGDGGLFLEDRVQADRRMERRDRRFRSPQDGGASAEPVDPTAKPATKGKAKPKPAEKPAPPAPPAAPTFPDGTVASYPPDKDPREVFAQWLIRPENPWFSRHIVNRAWYWLLGRGIVHEPDDIRPDNPAQNPELLNYLGQELVAGRYDLKHIFRLILNSKTYQLSPIAKTKDPRAAENFAYYPLRRLEAEVLIDAVCQLTGTTESYSSIIPEPYTFIPKTAARSLCPMAVSPARSWRRLAARHVIRAWNRSGTTR